MSWVLFLSVSTKVLLLFRGNETILGFSLKKTTGVCMLQQTFLDSYTSVCASNHERSYQGATNLATNIFTNFTFPETGTAIYCVQHLTQCSCELIRAPVLFWSEMVNIRVIMMSSLCFYTALLMWCFGLVSLISKLLELLLKEKDSKRPWFDICESHLL